MADTTIVMPKLGLTMSEGLLAEWHVKPGDEVVAGQTLFVVETDKITNEIEAPAEGTIRSVVVQAGETVPVGAVVAIWTGPDQSVAADGPEPAVEIPEPVARAQAIAAAPVPDDCSVAHTGGGRIVATPLARRIARQATLDIASVSGTGPRSRIQAQDVRAALEHAKPVALPAESSRDVGARNLRALIAARVCRSKAEIPHFYVTADAVFDRLAALRNELNASQHAPRKLSVTAFLGIAVAHALSVMPEADVLWREGGIRRPAEPAVGIAVDAPGGVMAPVVPFGGGIYDFAAALDAAIERARAGRLSAQDMGEAVVGISNVGMFGVRALTPIIDPDQTFMLGVGAPRRVFRPNAEGNPCVVQEVSLSLACDHRAVDGALACRFLAAVVDLLESPLQLLIRRLELRPGRSRD